MELWRSTFRTGIAPQLSNTGLTALAVALNEDDPRLLQGATCSPPPLQAVQDWPVEAADAIVFCYVVDHGGFNQPLTGPARSDGGCPVKDAEEFFARTCFECDRVLGEPAACRYWLNWYDDTPRDEMRRLLLSEVNRVLACRRLKLPEDVPDEILHDYAEEHMDVYARNEMEATGVAKKSGGNRPTFPGRTRG